jgi:hypothetical protein
MVPTVKFSCNISNTDYSAELGLEICIDDLQIFNQEWISGPVTFDYDFSDSDGVHELKFVMKNKTRRHTQCDAEGNIINDARLVIVDIAFDEIKLGQMMTDLSIYQHNFNGTGSDIQDKFYSEIGCNGTVTLPFTTPVYMWLLENM